MQSVEFWFFQAKKRKKLFLKLLNTLTSYISLLAWHSCSKSSQNKILKTQYKSLKLITNDCKGDYKFLLKEIGNSTMEINGLRTLALEIFKILNNLHPNFMRIYI